MVNKKIVNLLVFVVGFSILVNSIVGIMIGFAIPSGLMSAVVLGNSFVSCVVGFVTSSAILKKLMSNVQNDK